MNNLLKRSLKIIAILQLILILSFIPCNNYILKEIFSIDEISEISALEFGCCTETIEGAICQDSVKGISEEMQCKESIKPVKCEEYYECKTGCCIDEKEGLCTTQATKKKCENNGGKWVDSENCAITQCQKSCCVLGDKVKFVTEKRCEKLSNELGYEKDFRDYNNEIACKLLEEIQIKGACVLTENACRFITESECLSMNGKFHENILCSADFLNTSCEKQEYVSCVKDKIYWFDSCGNQENIYSSDKNASWNNGKVLTELESCGAGSPNTNSKTCGNCNYLLGSRCGNISSGSVENSGLICKDMTCIDEKENIRQNGESWCVYESYIGDGKDAVGSRHWRRMCVDGEVKTEPCADYRGQICAESNITLNNTKEKFSIAGCVMNEALKCLEYNTEDGPLRECVNNDYCMIKEINLGETFNFELCVGKYPRGFGLKSDEDDNSDNLCSIASQTCTVVYEKGISGSWNCVQNCECETEEFAEQMNDLCISLGDCGSYINYIGDGTENIDIKGAPEIEWQEYKKYAEPVKGQFAKINNSGDYFGINSGESESNSNSLQQEQAISYIGVLGKIASSTETAISAAAYLIGTMAPVTTSVSAEAVTIASSSLLATTTYTLTSISASSLGGAGATSMAQWSAAEIGSVSTATTTTTLGVFAGALAGIGIGISVGGYLAQWQGITGTAATVMTLAGGVAGGAVGAALVSESLSLTGSGALGLTLLGWTVVIAIIIIALISILGWGKTKTVEVEFECMPWQAPIGGNNCEECNNNPIFPCSKYKCHSLGQACELINTGSENPICVAIKDDGKYPEIFTGKINSNFTFTSTSETETKIRKNGGECIPEFTPIEFSLETSEYAQCKYSLDKPKDFKEMDNYFLERNDFTKNHSFVISMPSLSSLGVYGMSKEEREKHADKNIYVYCQDYYGNTNLKPYLVNFCINSGPDLTAPRIISSIPKSESYLKYGTNKTELTLYLNEPSKCRFDYSDISYENMKNNFNCNTNLINVEKKGWSCDTTINNLSLGHNKIYIRCKDQPWYANTINESLRNTNIQSYVHNTKISVDKLNISSIKPKGKIKGGVEPYEVNIEIKTEKGAKNGNSECFYKLGNNEFTRFFETYSNIHKQTLQLVENKYSLAIKCEDIARNIAEKNISFELELDESPPNIIRAYEKNDKLEILTDEEAECYYDFERCNFDLNKGIKMTTALSKVHTAEWKTGKSYNIKCKDVWGNINPLCAIKLKTD